MAATSTVRARIDPKLKTDVVHILEELGITESQAITMLYKQISREHGWPLELKIPNEATASVLQSNDKLVKCKDIDDLFHKLDEM